MMSSNLSGVSTLIYIGAGQATELENWVEQGFESIVLIEPHPVLANQLRLRSRKFPQVKVVESAITERAELSELYDYTISGMASLRQPTGLKQIFPGLQLTQRYTVATCRLAQIVNHYGPSPEQKAHLIIAAAGEEADLVDALLQSNQLERFLRISLKASIEPFYEGAEPASLLIKRLEEAGYELQSTKAIDSDWCEWLLQRDPLKDELIQQKEQAAQQLAALQSDLTRAQADAEKKKKEVEKVQAELQSTQEELQKTKEWFASRKKQAMELEVELKKEQEKNLRLSQENALLVRTQTTAEVGFAQLEDRMNQLFAQQTAQIQQVTNALGKHVTRSFVQQRQHYQSVLGLQHYLESGEQPLAFGGWAIGADVASHLVQALEQHSYDLIIEFGSGTSTALMAKVISQQMQRHNNGYVEELQLNYQDVDTPVVKTGRQAMRQARGLENYELPRRILSFEQDKNHFQQSKQLLASQGLSGVVELVLAPLVPSRFTHDAAHTALFYDCESQLARIAQLYEGRAARILVLVDGPFSPKSDPMVRAPALAQVLQYFSSKHLDIMLDDSLRDGEQHVVQHWRELCAERGLEWQEKELEADKGALWITVTP